jgi:hypothetical protein
VDETHITPAPKQCGWSAGFIRCLSVGASRSVFTDVEPGSGAVERRVEGLPAMTRVWFHAMGPTLGYPRTDPSLRISSRRY